MEPISVALLAALAGGAGGKAGQQAWAALSSLVRRPFRRRGNAHAVAARSGEAELAHLAESPDEVGRAHALSTALAVRAALDADFQADLRRWYELANSLDTGSFHNEISGGTFAAPVVQGRDFSHISFQTPSSPQAEPGTDTPTAPE
ncbi:hypothetical protein ACFWP5_13780 [Streptomyces sp. NPDC058469]|uniref:hypothetical protein n=1 Tax=Streptomyces sp. NPDC058469 TaxID=3346514 RepID=UPI00364F9966